MKNGICYIVGAGDNYGLNFVRKAEDYVIAVDGGFTYLKQMGLNPDLIIGDFDSLDEIPNHFNIIKLNCEKDETDTFAAVREGIKKGYTIFHIYCGTGGRTEHTMANIQLLAYLSQKKMKGYLFGKDDIITSVTDGVINFDSCYKGYISIFSCSDKSTGVFLNGLKYKLKNATVLNTFPIGVSNEFLGVKSSVTVKNGTLIVVFQKQKTHNK